MSSLCTRWEQANTRAVLVVARELLCCRLVEGDREALLSHVTVLLDTACEGTTPFRITPASRMPQEARTHAGHIYSPLREEPEGPRGGSSAHEIVHS